MIRPCWPPLPPELLPPEELFEPPLLEWPLEPPLDELPFDPPLFEFPLDPDELELFFSVYVPALAVTRHPAAMNASKLPIRIAFFFDIIRSSIA